MIHRPLVPILLAFTGGLLAASILPASSLPLMKAAIAPFLLAALALVLVCRAGKKATVAVVVLFFLLGGLIEIRDRPERPLASAALSGTRVTVEGTVLDPPVRDGSITRVSVRVDWVIPDGVDHNPGERILVSIYGAPPHLRPGLRIRFPARLRVFRNFENPGRYDYESAMDVKGYSCSASVSDGRRVVPMGSGSLGRFGDILENVRGPLREWIARTLPPSSGALIQALILGERRHITSEQREAFQRTGLAHILAVSGLHVGLVAWLVFSAARWLLSRSTNLLLALDVRKAAAAVTCLPVIAYALLAGFQVSTQRAMIMVLVYLVSIWADRDKDIWSTLCLAALLILAVNPDAIRTISFQLSFGAVAGIVWIAPALFQRLPNPFQSGDKPSAAWPSKAFDYAAGLATVTLAATLFLLPLTVHYFNRISLVSVPANLAVTPILGLWILPSGLLALVFFPLAPPVADFFLRASSLGLDAMSALVLFFSGLDWAAVWTVSPNRMETALLYAAILSGALFFRGRLRLIFPAACLLLAVDAAYWIHDTHLRRDLEVTFLDVGQGNAALVRFPRGERMLIDGGGFRSGGFDVGRMVVAPYLWRRKIARIHTLVLSHPEADHMNGLTFIAEHFGPKELWSNGDPMDTDGFRRFMEAVAASGMTVRTPEDPGLPKDISGVGVTMFHPLSRSPERGPPPDPNDRSLVFRLSFAGTSFLFPGDIGSPVEARVVARAGSRLRSDVLLAPHHGSRTSSSSLFLEAVRPTWCVISAGSGNRFGFPHPEVLHRYRAFGCRTARTDRDGAIRFTAAEGILDVRGYRSGPLH